MNFEYPEGATPLDLVNAGECRQQYINALRAADRHDYGLLLAFARS